MKQRVISFMQSTLTQASTSPEKQLQDLQALIILYMFGRSGAIEILPDSSSNVDFWSIKATCEAYALRMGPASNSGVSPCSAPCRTQHPKIGKSCQAIPVLALAFLHIPSVSIKQAETFVCESKLVAWQLLRERPRLLQQTLQSGSLPACSKVLNPIRQSLSSLQKLNFVWFGTRWVAITVPNIVAMQLLLISSQLGAKDPKIKEWWCASAIHDMDASNINCLKPEDVDTAIESCTHRLWFKDSTAFSRCSNSSAKT